MSIDFSVRTLFQHEVQVKHFIAGWKLFLFTVLGHNLYRMKGIKWIKRLGFWGFLFFLVKGLLWLLVPALIALWTTS